MFVGKELEEAIAEIKEMSIGELVNIAGCGYPSGAGIAFLENLRDDFCERAREGWDESALLETADGAPNVYTHQTWLEFVDLEAYNYPCEFSFNGDDMNLFAMSVLFDIALNVLTQLQERIGYDG